MNGDSCTSTTSPTDLSTSSSNISNTITTTNHHQRPTNLLFSYLIPSDDDDDDDHDHNVKDEKNSNDKTKQSSSLLNDDESERLEIVTSPLVFNKTILEQSKCDSVCGPMINNHSNQLKNSPSSSSNSNSSRNSRKIIENTIKNTSSSSKNNKENYVNIWNDNLIESSTPLRSQYRVVLEIIKARTVNQPNDRQKYVNYTILMKRIPGLETEPAIIERRYSEIRNFYNAIRRKYPVLLKDITFPPKIFIGNFSAEVIAERSLAFQKFLTYCLSLPEIRLSREFSTFLYYPEMREAKNCLKLIRLEEAASIFENVFYIQSKLFYQNGKPNGQLIHTLCCLIGCLNAVDNTQEAKKMAKKTFELLFENPIVLNNISNDNNNNDNYNGNGNDGGNNNNSSNKNTCTIYQVDNLYESSPLVLPLILLSLRHGWFVGKQKTLLEKKLEELCRKRSLPKNFDSHPKLLELILRKDFSPIL